MSAPKSLQLVFCPTCGSRLRPLGQPDRAMWCEWCELAMPPQMALEGVQQPPKPGKEK